MRASKTLRTIKDCFRQIHEKRVYLTRIRRMQSLRGLNVFAALLHSFVIGEVPNLMKPSHRFAPAGHGAFRIARRGVRESLFGFLVLEGMEESDALFDRGLHVRCATRREIHFAKLIGRRDRRSVRPKSRSWKGEKRKKQPEG